MRHIQLLATKIYFDVIEIYVNYMSNIFWRICLTFVKKIYGKYILYVLTYILHIYFFHVGSDIKISERKQKITKTKTNFKKFSLRGSRTEKSYWICYAVKCYY